ncbi:MAG: tRNA pseudouridine(38-40) synthase TruA [Candidatus Obscuribacterales bacterium]|nr:tRNA pseudouridine(38-40) synthase TruA [Candidatus Obscuribacterales bacterium]
MSELVQRVALKVEYLGEKFCGSQMQRAGIRTVQSELESALNTFFRCDSRLIKATFSGRTDTGVHALGQIVHFDLPESVLRRIRITEGNSGMVSKTEAAEIGDLNEVLSDLFLEKMCWAINGIVGKDLAIADAQLVPQDFHARFSATRRSYVYRILNRPQRSAVRQANQCFVSAKLDHDAMKRSLECLLGRHDFEAFKSSNADKVSTICLVDRAELLNKGEAELEFWISANHFVYNMVRIIVGTLLEVGLGKRAPTAFSEALAGKDRHLAGPTAPPWGLCLYSVDYPAEFSLFQRDSKIEISKSQENES